MSSTTPLPWTDVRDSLWDLLAAPRPRSKPRTTDVEPSATTRVRMSEVIAALSCALDITEGQPEGHAARTCRIGMTIAERIGLVDADRSALFYALQLKDLGCSSNAAKVSALFGADDRDAKRDLKTTDWQGFAGSLGYVLRNVAPGAGAPTKLERLVAVGRAGPSAARELVKIRCERGSYIAHMFGLPSATAAAIHSLDEHWNGRGHPDGLRGDAIPLLARIACLAQTVEVFAATHGVSAGYDVARARSGRWFDPSLVAALDSIGRDDALWSMYADVGPTLPDLGAHEPADLVLDAGEATLDRIALGFAQVVDAKSPWTYRHSEEVANLTVGVARKLGVDESELAELRRAALLHDLGKLGVSNLILDKPGKLTDDERAAMQAHPAHSERILSRVRGFARIAAIAGAHHERLDGKGYHRGLSAEHIDRKVRCLIVADMCEAISARRPYRDTMPIDKVLAIMREQAGPGICPQAFDALVAHVRETGFRAKDDWWKSV